MRNMRCSFSGTREAKEAASHDVTDGVLLTVNTPHTVTHTSVSGLHDYTQDRGRVSTLLQHFSCPYAILCCGTIRARRISSRDQQRLAGRLGGKCSCPGADWGSVFAPAPSSTCTWLLVGRLITDTIKD